MLPWMCSGPLVLWTLNSTELPVSFFRGIADFEGFAAAVRPLAKQLVDRRRPLVVGE